jgi:hypothetical protein
MSFVLSLYLAFIGFVILLCAISYRKKTRKPKSEVPKNYKYGGGEKLQYPVSMIIEVRKPKSETKDLDGFQRAITSVDEMDAAVKFTQDLINKDL